MLGFISTAYAADQAAVQSNAGFGPLIFMIAMLVIFYFLLIRPQAKRAKEHRNLVSGLGKGDEVITSGGILGRITEIDEDFITISIANNVEIKVQKPAVTTTVPKGTIKSLEG